MFKTHDELLIRGALAAVWIYQGLWCKIWPRQQRHLAIADAAGMGWALTGIGIVEIGVGAWVFLGLLPVAAASAQTALIAAMNAGGLWRGRRFIGDPAGMLLQNAAFLALAWVAAGVLHVG